MRYLLSRAEKIQLFLFVEELAEINELQDFLDLQLAAIARGYETVFEYAIDLQDTAYKRAIMRSWLVGDREQTTVPLVEHFVNLRIKDKEKKENAYRKHKSQGINHSQETRSGQKTSSSQGGDRTSTRTTRNALPV
jgi:hypothetical protein